MKIKKYTLPPKEGSIFGIFRFISSKLQIPDLDGYSLIKISADSKLASNISYKVCIGYNEPNKTNYFASNHSKGTHWYQMNMNFFRTTLTAYSLSMNPEHYHPTWDFLYSDDGLNWEIADQPQNQKNPEKNHKSISSEESCNSTIFQDCHKLTKRR